ncbi:MAG: hypothetical protein CMI13_09665 [Oleibacter sp.]|nr:hypothetical protein [Thalassolituus sp.]
MNSIAETGNPSTSHKGDSENWPLLSSERSWGSWQLLAVFISTAAATWCYIIGEYVGYYLNFKMGFASMTAGALIGIVLVNIAVLPMISRFGVDSVATSRAQFGSRGWVLISILQYVSVTGWNCLLLIFFAMSGAKLATALGFAEVAESIWFKPVISLIACAIVYAILLRGSSGVEKTSKLLFLLIIGISAWIIWMMLGHDGSQIMAAQPAYATPSRAENYSIGVEVGLVTNLTWWAYLGAMARVTPTASKANLPSILGFGLTVPLMSLIGLAAYLLVQDSDPSSWLIHLGGTLFGSIALLLVITANIGTSVAGVYVSAVGLTNIPGISKRPWPVTLALTMIPVVLISVFIPNLFFDNFGTLLALFGVIFAPLCGIQIADYYFLRRRKMDLQALYSTSPDAPYYFFKGVNIAGVLSVIIGFFVYSYLLDPITYESRAPFEYTTASIPTLVISAISYYLLTRIINGKKMGGY